MCWTASKALLILIATVAVRKGGFFSLKPWAMRVTVGRSAVVVECFGQKPCWEGEGEREGERRGRTQRLRILEAGQRREMGR